MAIIRKKENIIPTLNCTEGRRQITWTICGIGYRLIIGSIHFNIIYSFIFYTLTPLKPPFQIPKSGFQISVY